MPRPSKANAIRYLQQQLDEIPGIRNLGHSTSGFVTWYRNTRVAIANTFGELSSHLEEVSSIRFNPSTRTNVYGELIPPSESNYRDAFVKGLNSAAAILRSMITEVQEYWPDDPQEASSPIATEIPQTIYTNRVFVIHGRDHGARDSVARFLESLGLEPVILEEQPDGGLTVIEKFEQNASGDFVVALLTPDDVGGPNRDELQPRARQNVVLELGYFLGIFGRSRVRALVKGDIELPSDFSGVIYITIDDAGGWQMRLIREMKNAGMDIDANRAV